MGGQIRREFTIGCDMTLPNSAPLTYPLVGRINPFGKLRIRDDTFGQIPAHPGNNRTAHIYDAVAVGCGRSISGSRRSILVFNKAFPSYLIISIATPIAVAKPTASVPP